MCRAACLGYRNIVTLLVHHGGDLNIRSSGGRTPLMWAAVRDNVPMLKYLLELNADHELTDEDGWDAFDLACIKLNYNAAYHLYTEKEMRPKELAKYEKSLEVVDLELMF